MTNIEFIKENIDQLNEALKTCEDNNEDNNVVEMAESVKIKLTSILNDLKALDIIKKKNVDIELIKKSDSWLDYYTRYKHRTGYNTEIDDIEFVSLKEMIK